MPATWHARARWLPGAICVHQHESGNWHLYDPPYANGFQFTIGTWTEAGGLPSLWVSGSIREQLYRAWIIWRKRGWSHDWPNTSRVCGLR